MKNNNGPSKGLIILIVLIITSLVMGIFTYRNYLIYKSIKVSVKQNVIEYGSSNYNLKDIVDKVEGEIVSIKRTIDTSVVGQQEMVIAVEKNSVIKDVPIKVEVVDSIAPEITLKNEKLTFTEGNDINILDNVVQVVDLIDGDIEFKSSSEIDEAMNNYYTIEADSNLNEVGNHKVSVKAVDKYGNTSSSEFEVEVNPLAPKKLNLGFVYNDLPANSSSSTLVDMAYSLIGSPYVAGGNNPSGFDCSGFVQYVYGQIGKTISRSSKTQAYEGLQVSYNNVQPGDILSWGYGTTITHSALYVGNGMMIHATNPSQGVILSNVDAWARGSGTYILTVRRIL